MPTNIRDPRSIVTPEAFEIDPTLLGLPLARPSRRLWALLIDLAVVGALTAILSDVQLLLWGTIAVVLMWMALKRHARPMGQAAGIVLRVSAGCLGLTILATVLLVWGIARMGQEERREALGRVVEETARRADLSRSVTSGDLSAAATEEEAEAVLADMMDGLSQLPITASARREILRAAIPPGAHWSGRGDSLVDAVMARSQEGDSVPPLAGDVDALSGEEALAELARLGPDSAATPRAQALRRRAAGTLAADTLAALGSRVDELEQSLAGEREARADLEREVEEARGGLGAVADLLADLWDQLGSAIGLWSLYFTVLSTVWKGQTIGKKLTGVRVLRLDGQPMGWWSSFERAGGYVAGLATGLLGFAQVLWDPNRQCIHDKIVGTVVVVAGGERIPGAWEEAWGRRRQP